MSTTHNHPFAAAVGIAAILVMSGCATAPGAAPAPTSTTVPSDQRIEEAEPAPPRGRVIATGTVLDAGGDAQLCLGAVAESYPPQCSGIPLDDWTWSGVDGSETSGEVTWGTYAVYGTYDGDRYTVTDPPIMLALYDPIRPEDPTGGVEGTTSESELTRVQDDIVGRLGERILSAGIERGYVWVGVAWDDGTLQKAMDAEYGEDVVVVTSSMRPVD